MEIDQLDEIDRAILAILRDDGRITNVELAKRVGISAPPCLRRVRTLEEKGFIVGYHADLHPEVVHLVVGDDETLKAPGVVVSAAYDGEHLFSTEATLPEHEDLEALFSILARDAERLKDPVSVGNISRNMSASLQDYLNALPEDYQSIDQIVLGLEGEQLTTKFAGEKHSLTEETPKSAALIEALIIAHDHLARRMPKWQEFLSKTNNYPSLGDLDIQALEENMIEISDHWEDIPETVDPTLVGKLKQLKALLRSGEDASRAALQSIHDILAPVLIYAKEVCSGAAQHAKPQLKKAIGVILTTSIVGGVLTLSAQLPWWGAALSRAIEFLKAAGLL